MSLRLAPFMATQQWTQGSKSESLFIINNLKYTSTSFQSSHRIFNSIEAGQVTGHLPFPFSTLANPLSASIASTPLPPLIVLLSFSLSCSTSAASSNDFSAKRSAVSFATLNACTPCANWSTENSRLDVMLRRRDWMVRGLVDAYACWSGFAGLWSCSRIER